MRAALIGIDGQPRGAGGAMIGLAGKSLARRQLDFALSAGAERIMLLGPAGSSEAKALRHEAERFGAKVQQIGNSHGLLGAMSAIDELLVLAPGLLPDAPEAVQALGKGSAVLVLPAALGTRVGFERIDVERAWAGALVLPGRLVERLAELPADSEPTSALLRIALQGKVIQRPLPEDVVAQGSWAMLDANGEAAAEQAWLARNLSPPPPMRLTAWLAHLALQKAAFSLLGRERTAPLVLAIALLLLGGGIFAAGFGWAAPGFVLLALAAIAGEAAAGLARLARGSLSRRIRLDVAPNVRLLLFEAALAIAGALAVEHDWLHRLFPPLVLFGLLRALRPSRWPGPAALAGDPVLLALTLALAAAFGLAELALMALALALIGLQAVQIYRKERLTRA